MDAGDGGGDGATRCESEQACGSPPRCCGVGMECFRETCVEACESGVRCGAAGELCCAAGEVCVADACVAPAGPCGDSFDCEEGWYCEPVLGRCLPQPGEGACEVRPEGGVGEAVVEWRWEGVSGEPDFRQVAATPAVADIDRDGVPEVVFVVYWSRESLLGPLARLVVLDGRSGAEELVGEPGASLGPWSSVAVGDLDGDEELEIVVHGAIGVRGGRVSVFDPDGELLWAASHRELFWLNPQRTAVAPALANVDEDPQAEVLVAGVLLDHDGTLLLDAGRLGCVSFGPMGAGSACASTFADLDGDGRPELVGGERAVRLDGSTLWEADRMLGGLPAVADFDGDGQPEVVSVGAGQVRIRRGIDGALLVPAIDLPGGGTGGPPTVADFDGDGRPEVGVAGAARYVVVDLDCLPGGEAGGCGSGREDGLLWVVETQDRSSSTTGSSVFDFDGDGRAEVVYNDECHLRVYDGRDGSVLLQLPNTSQTAMEYPLVADVDGDGNSEFVVPANDAQLARDGCEPPGTHGIAVFGDPSDRWVRTRPIWNQHTYHVTNVGSDGRVPASETPSWTVPELNSYRQNVQGLGVFNEADLRVETLYLEVDACPAALTLAAVVVNRGSRGVLAGVPVSFYVDEGAGDWTLLGTVETDEALLPGARTIVRFEMDLRGRGEPPWRVRAVADDDGSGVGAVTECDEENNAATVEEASCVVLI